MNDEAVELLREIDAFLRQSSPPHRERDWHKLLTRCLALLALAAPQPSTAHIAAASSSEDVGQGEVASAAPDSGMPEEPKPFTAFNSAGLLITGYAVRLKDYNRLRAYAISLRERQGRVMVMVPKEPS